MVTARPVGKGKLSPLLGLLKWREATTEASSPQSHNKSVSQLWNSGRYFLLDIRIIIMRRNGKMSLKRNNDAIENYAIELEIPVKCRSHAIPAECYEVRSIPQPHKQIRRINKLEDQSSSEPELLGT
jgi:hypothetical protein